MAGSVPQLGSAREVPIKYFDEAKALWVTYVPKRGQADTVQGELMRAIEKLRDEAQRNGNINWDDGHEILAAYVRDTLIGSGVFAADAEAEISADVTRLLDYERPETSDDPFDRLSDRVVEWARAQEGPVPRDHNPDLHR